MHDLVIGGLGATCYYVCYFLISTWPSSSFFLLKYFTILQKMNKTLLGPLKLSLISLLAGNPRVAQFFDLLQYRWVHLHGWTYYFIGVLIGSSVVPVIPEPQQQG